MSRCGPNQQISSVAVADDTNETHHYEVCDASSTSTGTGLQWIWRPGRLRPGEAIAQLDTRQKSGVRQRVSPVISLETAATGKHFIRMPLDSISHRLSSAWQSRCTSHRARPERAVGSPGAPGALESF